jgi:hypothetical protein
MIWIIFLSFAIEFIFGYRKATRDQLGAADIRVPVGIEGTYSTLVASPGHIC